MIEVNANNLNVNLKAMEVVSAIIGFDTEKSMGALLTALFAYSNSLDSPKGFRYTNTLTLDGKRFKAELSFSAKEIKEDMN